MYYNIADTLEFVTKYTTLLPGDMILTGTPSGIGPVKIGDVMYANIIQHETAIIDMKFTVEEDIRPL